MTVSLVQSTSTNVAGSNNTTITLTGVAAGNALVLAVWVWDNGAGDLSSVTDDRGNTWQVAKYQNSSVQGGANIYYVPQAIAGTTVVTVNTGFATAYYSLVLIEFSCTSGFHLEVDQTSGAANANNVDNVAAAPALTAGSSEERLFVALAHYNTTSGTAPTVSTPSGFTNIARQTAASNECGSVEYQIATSTGAVSASWGSAGNTQGTDGWHAALASFSLVANVARPEYVGGVAAGFVGGTGTGTQSLTGLSGGLASAPAEGDLVIVAYAIGTAGRNPTQTITGNNSGAYLAVTGSPLLSAADTYDADLAVFYQFMGATPDTQVTRSATGNVADGGALSVHVWRGVDPTTPFDVTPTTATGQDTDRANPPSITPSTDGAVVVVAAAGAAGNLTTAWTSSDLSNLVQANGADTNDGRAALGSFAWTAGAFDPAQFGGGSGNTANSWCAITMALRPEPTSDDIAPGGLASTVALGSPTLAAGAVDVAPGGVASTVALGSPTVVNATPLTDAGGVAPTAAFGTPVMAVGAVDLAPGGVASTVALGSPTVAAGAVDVAPGGVASTVALGTPTGAPGAVSLFPAGVAPTAAFGTAVLAPGVVDVAPGGVAPTVALGTPAVSGAAAQEILGAGALASTVALGTPVVAPGAVDAAPAGLAPTVAFGTPVMATGAVDVAPGGMAPTVALGTPSVVPGAVAVSVAGLAPTVGLGTPLVASGEDAMAVPGLASGAAMGTPSVSGDGDEQFSVGGEATAALFPIDGVFEPPDVRRRTG